DAVGLSRRRADRVEVGVDGSRGRPSLLRTLGAGQRVFGTRPASFTPFGDAPARVAARAGAPSPHWRGDSPAAARTGPASDAALEGIRGPVHNQPAWIGGPRSPGSFDVGRSWPSCSGPASSSPSS